MHKAIHEDDRPFSCDREDCDKKFRRLHHLENHLRWHDDERPFTCDEPECDAEFTQEAHLTAHKKGYHTSEGQQIRKKKEQAVARALEKASIEFKREHQITFDCFDETFARTDFLIVKDGGILIVEVDEDQHSAYSTLCDVARMTKIIAALRIEGNTLPIGILRYNPDSFTINDKNQRKLQRNREQTLIQTINEWKFAEIGSFEIQYMFYNCQSTDDGQFSLDIWDEPEYESIMVECCRPPIV